MITFIVVLAALAVFYGLLWHDLPAETHRKRSTNAQVPAVPRQVLECGSPRPLSNGAGVSEPLSNPSSQKPFEQKRQGTAALQDAVAPRQPFARLRVNSIGAEPQR